MHPGPGPASADTSSIQVCPNHLHDQWARGAGAWPGERHFSDRFGIHTGRGSKLRTLSLSGLPLREMKIREWVSTEEEEADVTVDGEIRC
jgi:hypothetical protein